MLSEQQIQTAPYNQVLDEVVVFLQDNLGVDNLQQAGGVCTRKRESNKHSVTRQVHTQKGLAGTIVMTCEQPYSPEGFVVHTVGYNPFINSGNVYELTVNGVDISATDPAGFSSIQTR